MKSSSSELVLDIKTQKSGDNPYDYNKLYPMKQKNPKEADQLKEIFIQIASVVLICFYYALIVKPKKSYIEVKFYHSLSLGIICLVDFLFNKDQYNINIKEEYDTNLSQLFIEKDDSIRNMSTKELYIASLTYGSICFAIEILIFMILTYSVHFNNTLTNGFCLLALEIIAIRFHKSYNNDNKDFMTFVGMAIVIFVFVYDDIKFFHYGYIRMLLIALITAALKFIKFTLYYNLNRQYKMQSIIQTIFYANLFDSIMGVLILSIYLYNATYFNFDLIYLSIIFMGAGCYYFNMKYFTSVRFNPLTNALIYPIILIFDILINKDYFSIGNTFMSLFISLSVVLIYNNKNYNIII
jgi:hypothetical protein